MGFLLFHFDYLPLRLGVIDLVVMFILIYLPDQRQTLPFPAFKT